MTDLNEVYKSVLEADNAAVVICDLDHTIIYMNPAAINRYQKWGGKDLVGKSLLACHNDQSREKIKKVLVMRNMSTGTRKHGRCTIWIKLEV